MIQLPVPYHQQDLENFCGPATAQMILEPIIGSLVAQGVLHATMAAPSPAEKCKLGLTSPKQLELGLNATQQSRVPQFQAYYFEKQADGTAATAVIVQTLQLGIAAAALILSGGHWVAVIGAAMPADDPDGQPEALYINNPWPPVPSTVSQPPPHVSRDGCGSGGQRGQAEQVVTVPGDGGWYADYFTPVNMCRGTKLKSPVYIVIGAAGLAVPTTTKVRKAAVASGHAARARSKKSSMIDHGGAVELVRGAIERYGLVGPEFAEARFERPRIVKYLGVEDEAYYLVPLRWPDGSVLVGRVDAHRHTYLGAQLRPPEAIRTDAHYHLAEPGEVLEWIREGHIEFEGRRAAEYRVREELAWRPCVESRSPYYPFYQVTSDGETVGYIGLDGTPYSKLHDLLGG